MTNSLKSIRESMGRTQTEMSVLAGVSIGFLAALENGRVDWNKMQGRTRRGIAIAYGLDAVSGEPLPAQEPQPASSQASG